MGKKKKKSNYKRQLRALQVQLVALQRHIICTDRQILLILEGRDAAGKDGAIKRITQHLSPRETRVVALGKPSNRESNSWYFQRYVSVFPAGGEVVIMNRSWYNRAGVERVMDFCSDLEYEDFMEAVVPFEHMLVKAGFHVYKYYLDISKEEQAKRLQERRDDPLKHWKISPIDQAAQDKWDAYSKARNAMLLRTHNPVTPWFIVKADNKKKARLNIISHMLSQGEWPEKSEGFPKYDPKIVFEFDEKFLSDGVLAK